MEDNTLVIKAYIHRDQWSLADGRKPIWFHMYQSESMIDHIRELINTVAYEVLIDMNGELMEPREFFWLVDQTASDYRDRNRPCGWVKGG